MIPLTKLQNEIMREFYSVPATKVIYNKKQRDSLWKLATVKSNKPDLSEIKKQCPALEHQICKSITSGGNIQSAVFSECVYAQTFANMMHLDRFVNCFEQPNFIPHKVSTLLHSYGLTPRYAYSTDDQRRMLIQAGGCGGVDSALITVIDLTIYTIEFKEPGAKTSEPDLPQYGEDGRLVVTAEWLAKYPQFKDMLDEQNGLNFFDVMGSNVNQFSKESITTAVSDNYSSAKKFADVICTEDVDGNLVMMPTNQVAQWAEIEGEIRPAGRNSYRVWTPNALKRFLLQKNAVINGNTVTVRKDRLTERRQRGGNRKVSGYKVNSLFFVRIEDCSEQNGELSFPLDKVWQLKPTITAKVFFGTLKHQQVKNHYGF